MGTFKKTVWNYEFLREEEEPREALPEIEFDNDDLVALDVNLDRYENPVDQLLHLIRQAPGAHRT